MISAFALAGFCWVELTPHPLIERLVTKVDHIFYDMRTRISLPKNPDTGPVVIVAIDEKSLVKGGRWPWPRERLAKLVEKLREYGVLVTAFDIVFAEPEENLAGRLVDKLQDGSLEDVDFDKQKVQTALEQISDRVDGDTIFANSLDAGDVVMGLIFHHDKEVHSGGLPYPIVELDGEVGDRIIVNELSGYTSNLNGLQESAIFGGFLTVIRDEDGVIRRAPILLRYGDNLYPSLSLEAVRQYLLMDGIQLDVSEIGEAIAVENVWLGDKKIPTDAVGQVLVPFRGPAHTFPYVSAIDVIEGTADPKLLENALVFIGTSALGLADLQATAVDNVYPGVEVHANMAASILQGKFPYQPSWAPGAELVSLILVGMILVLLLPHLGAVMMGLVTCIMLVVLIGGNTYLWSKFGMNLSFTVSLSLVLTLSALNWAYGFLFAGKQRAMIQQMFGQYVPAEHVAKMSEDPEAYSFDGESREMTVLFSDIRGFTSISEKLEAAELKKLLNMFFTPITKVIFEQNGTIDKYVGDMIMAFWGAPLADKNHAKNAIESALIMLKMVEKMKFEFAKNDLPEINIGIGINTGIMSVGDMGSEYRRSYTVLGDAVNLGSRLEASTKFYGVNLIVGEKTRENQSDYIFRLLDRVKVKGKAEAVEIYEPICRLDDASSEILNTLSDHEAAMAYYFDQSWDKAKRIFSRLHAEHPEMILYKMYLERVEALAAHSPGEYWDGAFVRTEK